MNLNAVSGGIMLLVLLAAMLIGLRYQNRSRWHQLLFIYTVISFSQISAQVIINNIDLSPNTQSRFANAAMNIYLLSEFILFYILFYASFSKWTFRLILHAGVIGMLAITYYQWYYSGSFYTDYYVTGFAQLFFLMIPCMLFLFDKFITIGFRFITEDPRFWPITGMLLLSSCMLPLFFGVWENLDILYNKQRIDTVNNFLYVILFSSVIMALSCKSATHSNKTR